MPNKNIVLIMTDNQQATTLACYGNTETYTPNADKLAQQGVIFDNAFCPNAFCSPCRASVLTGMLPSQHGVHSWIDDRKADQWPVGWHALNGLRTLPQLLKQAGYKTALTGKYHLGDPKTSMPGFDYWVTLEDGHVRSFYRNRIFDNGNSYHHEGNSVDFFTGKAQEFIVEQATAKQPFFLFVPYPAPYGHWPATREADRCRHSERYDDCPMHTIPRCALSAEAVAGYDMRKANSGGGLDYSMLMRAPNDMTTLRNYYAQISMVDDGVGALMDTLDQHNLADDTLFIFTADHGLSVGQHGFWGHGSGTFPSNMHRAAHSVPLIIRDGASDSAGARRSAMVSNMDVFSTIVEAAQIDNDDDSSNELPSRSLVSLLRDATANDWQDDVVFSEQEETRVCRTEKWAYFQRFDGSNSYPIGDELYDIELDPEEAVNLADDPAFADIKALLKKRMTDFFSQHVKEQADLWRGGVPLQNTERLAFWKDVWGEQWAPVYAYDDTADADSQS